MPRIAETRGEENYCVADRQRTMLLDSICLDAEGCVWVSSPTTNEFLRMREGGIVEDRIEAGGDRPAIACMLGGADRTTLYLITAPTASIEGSIPLRAGRIETVQVEVPGVGWP